MKKTLFLMAIAALCCIVSCRRNSCYNQYCLNGGSCFDGGCQCPPGVTGVHCDSNHNGQLSFWAATNCNCGPITVSCGSYVQQMQEYYPNGVPACGSPGSANFNLPAGTYNYTASCPAASWSGSVTVTQGNCTMQQIVCTTGNVTFWMDTAGNSISVSVGGQTLNITTAYTSSNPNCGASGCANFLLPTGTYTYNASSASNTWSGHVVVANDSCTLVKIL
jgi:hypothetical protein